METLGVFVVPLTLLLAALSGTVNALNHTSPELTMVVVDEINDAIRYYNNHIRQGPPVKISDVVGKDEVSPEKILQFALTEGKMVSRSIKFLPAEAKVWLEVKPERLGTDHILTSLVPFTIKGLELIYDKFKVEIVSSTSKQRKTTDGQISTEHAPRSSGIVRAIVGKNKFVAEVKVYHIYSKGEKEGVCVVEIPKIKIEQFEVKRVNIKGLDHLMEDILELVVNHFKNKFAEHSFAHHIIERLIEERSSVLFPHCIGQVSPRHETMADA